MVNVETEVSKYKNCKDRDELVRAIRLYKDLALKHASNMVTAGKYSMVALKLQEICDKLPAPRLKGASDTTPHVKAKTAAITNEETAKINAAWKQRTEGTRKDGKN